MPELRKDPVVGRWVIIATERARRPGNIVERVEHTENHQKDCKFCLPQEEPILNGAVQVISFKTSFLSKNQDYYHQGHGLYDVVNAFGAHELVIESKEHVGNMADLPHEQITAVIRAYASRMGDLSKNRYFQYVVTYKNYGSSAGSRDIHHARSHIMAIPVQPLRVKEKLTGAKNYFTEHGRCVFCDMIKQEVEEKARVIINSEHYLAIIPFAACFLFEVLILPKRHHCDFPIGVQGTEEGLARVLKEVLLRFKMGLDDPAYNYAIHTAPLRRASGRRLSWKTLDEDYHWHLELVPRLTKVAGFEKGTYFYINAISPELTAEYLREVEL